MLYQIHRYPADLIDVVRIGSDQRVLIRPVLPQDADVTRAFFASMPARARYQRFLAPMSELPPQLIERFTSVDFSSHVALLAEVFAEGHETVVAEARYACRADPKIAELAVSVAEAWQGRGLARLLLGKLLARAASAGVTRLVAETLTGNDRVLQLAHKAGFTATPSTEVRGVMLLEKALAAPSPDHA